MTAFKPLDWQVNDNYSQYFIINALGPVPKLLNANDARQVKDQLNEVLERGWVPEGPDLGWQFNEDCSLQGNGLPPVMPVAYAQHILERLYMYPAQFMVICQLDGSYQVGRII